MSAALLEHATTTIAVGSKSFAAAARLFDPATRRGVLMLYAWCRHCDDVVDGQELGFGAPATAHDPQRELATLYALTRRAYSGAPMHEAAFAALQEVALAHRIAPRYAFDHLAGFGMDVAQVQYDSIDDTLLYCYHVAGVVGLMMAAIMGARQEAVLDHACDLGIAFQLTNIARDIVDDAVLGRCYLPAQWLREAGIPRHELALPRHRQALATVAARLLAHAEPYYASAGAGLAALPLRSAWAIASARNVYRQIGVEVLRRGSKAWDTRAGTTRATKLRLLAAGAVQALTSRIRRPQPRPAGLWQRPTGYAQGPHHAAHATDV